jgi:pyrroline-5-carboxylate reductase
MPPLQSCKIAFIGGGNMATAIIKGLGAKVPPSHVTVSEPLEAARSKLAALGVRTTSSNAEATSGADLVVLAVKPQVARSVCGELASAWTARSALPTVLSIAAGITLASLGDWLRTPDGRVAHIVRAMPNTPALVGEGAAGVFAGSEVTADEKALVGALLESISHATEWVGSEGMLDVVTGLSGWYPTSLGLGLTNCRVWTRILLPHGGAPDRQCGGARHASRAGDFARGANMPRRRQDAGRIFGQSGAAAEERDESQWHDARRVGRV